MSELQGIRLLYVEDETDLRQRIRIMLEMDGLLVTEAENGDQALKLLDGMSPPPDLVLSDIRMPILDGLRLAQQIRNRNAQLPIILCTAFTDAEYLIEAIKLGINGFVNKPVDYELLVREMTRVTQLLLQQRKIAQLEQEAERSFDRLLGASPQMHQIAQQVRRLATASYPLLILGETGSGKSHLARLIHDIGPRASKPFVTVHLGGLPESIAEAELFGHTKGAFSGATSSRQGLFRQANGGTLFLDDIDTGSHAIQSKILHILDTRQVTPLGADQPVPVDLRIITASNQDLTKAVREQRFRQDLYYRIENLSITLPPLRQRTDEIVSLALSFLAQACEDLKRTVPQHDPSFEELLRQRPWPGNLRELKSTMQRVAVMAGDTLTGEGAAQFMEQIPCSPVPHQSCTETPQPLLTLDESEARTIQAALAASNGRKMEAARLLAVDYQRFKRLLLKHGLY